MNVSVFIMQMPYTGMHACVRIYYVEDLLMTLGNDKFSYDNKRLGLAISVITYFSTKLL